MTNKRKAPFGVAESLFSADQRDTVIPMRAPHVHNQVELNLILSGTVRYLFNGRVVDLKAGDFVFFWGSIPHQVTETTGDAQFACIYVPVETFMFTAFSKALKLAILSGGFVRIDEKLALDTDLMLMIQRELRASEEVLSTLNYAHLELRLRRADHTGWTDLLETAPKVSRTLRSNHRKVVEMTRYISANADTNIQTDDVARAADLHPKYAMSLFRQSTGMTITQYLLRCRLVTAQHMLLGSEKNAAAVAFEAGFGSVSRFYKVFREQTGMSPKRFRDVYRLVSSEPA
nr:helix-turn-helix domain-containing protein [Marinicella sp. W31]MDC2875617.1 helix-turn-helix domain-containing protein [Marinicella sp. W31]